MDTDMTRVLDVYAGSGALGIEALSRGAESCDFVERDAGACAVIKENLLTLASRPGQRLHAVVALSRALKVVYTGARRSAV
jgi:16S rRNA (guanine966-N2)-methyltransferase